MLSNYSFNESLLKAEQNIQHGSNKENISENLPEREFSKEVDPSERVLNMRHLNESMK